MINASGQKQNGFIIIDVLSASMIMVIGICASMAAISHWHHAGQQMGEVQTSGYLAQDGFESVRAHCSENWTRRCLEEKSGSERLIRKGIEYERTLALRDRLDLDHGGRLVEASIKITWTKSGSLHQNDFFTYYLVNVPVGNLR